MTARRSRHRLPHQLREQQRERRRAPETATRVSVQLRQRQWSAYMPGAGGLRASAARHRHRGRVRCRHITGALAGTASRTRRATSPTARVDMPTCSPCSSFSAAQSLLVATPGRCSRPSHDVAVARRRGAQCARAAVSAPQLGAGGGQHPGAGTGCSCRRPARSTRAGVAGAAAGPPTLVDRALSANGSSPGVVPARAKRCAATGLRQEPWLRLGHGRRPRCRRREIRRRQRGKKVWSRAFVR